MFSSASYIKVTITPPKKKMGKILHCYPAVVLIEPPVLQVSNGDDQEQKLTKC